MHELKIRQSTRLTIMDGPVVEYAVQFQGNGKTGLHEEVKALGPFEVSASRNMVMVHRAELRGEADCRALIRALELAQAQYQHLAGRSGWRTPDPIVNAVPWVAAAPAEA